MHYVYILKSINHKKHYTGSSDDIKRRLHEHNQGKVKSTKFYKPYELVYYEAHLTENLAKKAEMFYKTSQGRRQIEKKLGLI